MKRFLCTLICTMLILGAAHAEVIPDITIGIQPVTPTPSAEPKGAVFSSEDLIVTLPVGMSILSEGELAGYEAAVQADFPDAARMIIAAMNEAGDACLTFSMAESTQDAAAAAREAAQQILSSDASVTESLHGENGYAGFACAIGEQTYRLYYHSNGNQLLIIGASGLDEAEIATMLAELIF